jgi:hypothetical protein
MLNLSKTETEILEVHIEFARVMETIWRSGRSHSAGDYIRPTIPNGFELECTTGGQTGSREPRWPITAGITRNDGSAIWTARTFSTNATDTISSVNLETPLGISTGSVITSGTEVSFLISSGVNGSCYTVSVEVSTNAGEILEQKIEIIIDGD